MGATLAGPPTKITFGGANYVEIPTGAEVLSDPFRSPTADLEGLTIDLYIDKSTGAPTRSDWLFGFGELPPDELLPEEIPDQIRPAAFSAPGNWAGSPMSDRFRPIPFEGFVAAIDVLDRSTIGTVVIMGDSTTVNYPPFLASRAARHDPRLAVVNAGVCGNRMLTSSPGRGGAGLARFPHDALLVTGARSVIAMWINDLGMSDLLSSGAPAGMPKITAAHTDANDLIAGWRQLITRAHSQHLPLIAGTTPPFKGAFYWTADKEKERQRLNAWIRTSGEPDGIADFDQALRDPGDREQLAPRYHMGDFLHPSPAGSRAMADCIDLSQC